MNWWSPIFNRWTSHSFKYEDYRVDSINIILKLYSGLVKYKITKVVNFTAIPHHIDSLLLSIAAKANSCEELHLYANVFDGRLIPISQFSENSSRSTTTKISSKVDYREILKDFISNKLNGNPPKLNTKVNKYKKSYYLALFYLIFLSISNSIRLILPRKKLYNSIFDFFIETNFYENVKMLTSQKLYLSKFDNIKLSLDRSYETLRGSEVLFVLAAHFQPEATSFPEGGNWASHIEILYKLKSMGISNIAYKEHPATRLYFDKIVGMTKVGMYRSKSYLNKLIELNCLILDERVNLSISDSLCENYFPITITGTIALERSLAGLKTIVVGEPWFKGLPGIYSFDDLANIKNQINFDFLKIDIQIAQKSTEFLLNLLNDKTLDNYLGIGTGKPLNSSEEKEKFFKSLDILLKI